MAIGLRLKVSGGTQQNYAAHGIMDMESDPPKGMIFHSAGPIEGGWGIIDFWESRDAFDRFLESGFGPAAQELGDRTFTTPPDIKEFPVHNITKP